MGVWCLQMSRQNLLPSRQPSSLSPARPSLPGCFCLLFSSRSRTGSSVLLAQALLPSGGSLLKRVQLPTACSAQRGIVHSLKSTGSGLLTILSNHPFLLQQSFGETGQSLRCPPQRAYF